MRLTIENTTYIYLIILLFFVPLPWLTAWLVAVSVHELSHIAAVYLCGEKVNRLKISVGGIHMSSGPMSDVRRIICTLSGPIGGFLPVILCKTFPRVAICAWVLSAYNLLPILPLDGGHILLILMRDNIWFHRVQCFFVVSLVFLSVYAFAFLKIGLLPLMITVILLLKHRKTPCKKASRRVQ